jgi:hypothetical protein
MPTTVSLLGQSRIRSASGEPSWNQALRPRFHPIFIAVIIDRGFLLPVLAFRSLLIPAVVAVMNRLAAL